MQIVNLRHPGYPDSSNIILTLQAPDDPNGGIHAETLRLAGCVVAGNRWDGFLSITQEHPKPVVPDHDGVLRRKDYYFHLPSNGDLNVKDGVVDCRKRIQDGQWPIVARFADWEWPEEGMPEIWKLAGDAVVRQQLQSNAGDGNEDDLPKDTCQLCGREEDRCWTQLWSCETDGERKIFEREKWKISIAENLRSDYDSDEEDDNDEESGSEEESESEEEGENDEEGNGDEVTAEDSQDEDVEEGSEKIEETSTIGSDATSEGPVSGDNGHSEASVTTSNPLRDDRNYIRIGKDCSAEPEHCDFKAASNLHQLLFVPKLEGTSEPILSAHIFATRELGITDASHNLPLRTPWKISLELLFAHFVQGVFEQTHTFFVAGVERTVQVVDVDGTPSLLNADVELCKLLTVPLLREYGRLRRTMSQNQGPTMELDLSKTIQMKIWSPISRLLPPLRIKLATN